MNVSELSAKIGAIQTELKGIFDAGRTEDGSFDLSADQFAVIEAKELELKGLGEQLDRAKSVERIAENTKAYHDNSEKLNRLPVGDVKAMNKPEAKSLGELYVESKSALMKEQSFLCKDFDPRELGFKTNFTTSAGWAAEPRRSDVVALSAQRPISLLDYLPSQTVQVGSTGFRFMLETTYTNAAAELAEAGTYAEGALAMTEQMVPIRKVGVTIPVTDEQLEDVGSVQDYLTQRLGFMLRQRLESQVLSGAGTGNLIKGLTAFSGVLTQAKGSDNGYDAIYKAITKIRAQGYTEPNLLVIHPTDWQAMRIAQNSVGSYIWDNPAVGGAQTMYGLPVIVSTVTAQGTAVLMDTNFASVVYRHGIEFVTTNSHSDEFLAGIQRIRADVRAAVALYRGPAVATVTGL